MNRNFDFLQVLAVVFGALVAVVLGDAFSVRGCSLGVGGFSCPGSSMRSGQRFGAVVVDRGFLAVGGSSDGDNRPSQGNTDLRKSTTTSNNDRLALMYSLSAALFALVCLCLACFYYFKKRRH